MTDYLQMAKDNLAEAYQRLEPIGPLSSQTLLRLAEVALRIAMVEQGVEDLALQRQYLHDDVPHCVHGVRFDRPCRECPEDSPRTDIEPLPFESEEEPPQRGREQRLLKSTDELG